MKHIQSFENIENNRSYLWNNTPQINDYVYCQTGYAKDFNNFLKNEIGQIIKIKHIKLKGLNPTTPRYNYIIEFQKPYGKYDTSRNSQSVTFELKNIIYYSKNKEDVQTYLDALKYNL